jgi:single-stranded-DNA-specific exonuclease
MNESVWTLGPDTPEAERLASELGIPLPIARVLINRNITEPESAQRFLFGSIGDLHDPFLMAGMAEAVDRIIAAVERGEKILIFGDYDVDGVLSVVMLHKALVTIGAKVDYYIPERLREGYGIKEAHVAVATERGARLVISVDCGIRAAAFARRAKEVGLDVIITDHHPPGPELPRALAILNPTLPGSSYPDRSLAGVGVAFKLIQALLARKGKERQIRHYMKLVSIGTISDVAQLRGENRLFVKFGLRELEDVSNIGLRSLIEACGLKGKKISEGDVGFRIGPRINAAGRMGLTELAVKLFFSATEEESAVIVRQLDELNTQRQAAEEKIFKQALDRIKKKELDKNHKILILGCEEWHRGIIGIVASRIKEAFCRPVILFAYDDGRAFGSGRSISEFSLINCLEECREYFLTYGGHPLAVGCSLLRESFPDFRKAANGVADSRITDEQMRKKIAIDARLGFSEITGSFLDNFALLDPFGVGNPRPVFMTEGAELVGPPQKLLGRHAKLFLRNGGRTFEAIGWDKGEWVDDLRAGDSVAVAYGLRFSSYQGEERLSLSLEGLRK